MSGLWNFGGLWGIAAPPGSSIEEKRARVAAYHERTGTPQPTYKKDLPGAVTKPTSSNGTSGSTRRSVVPIILPNIPQLPYIPTVITVPDVTPTHSADPTPAQVEQLARGEDIKADDTGGPLDRITFGAGISTDVWILAVVAIILIICVLMLDRRK